MNGMNGESMRKDVSKTDNSEVCQRELFVFGVLWSPGLETGMKSRRSLTISRYQSQKLPQKNW